MPCKPTSFRFDENGMRELREQLLRRMTDDDMQYICMGCRREFHPRHGRIVCPACGLEYL